MAFFPNIKLVLSNFAEYCNIFTKKTVTPFNIQFALTRTGSPITKNVILRFLHIKLTEFSLPESVSHFIYYMSNVVQ